MATIKSEFDYIQEARSNLAEALVRKFGVREQDIMDSSGNVIAEGLWKMKSDGNGGYEKDYLKRLHDWTLLVNTTSVGMVGALTFTNNGSGDAPDVIFDGSTDKTISYNSIGAAPNIAFIGATASTAGTMGLVPAPLAGDQNKVLSAAGTWVANTEDTWRGIYTEGTSRIGTGISTKAINYKGNNGITVGFLAAGTAEGQSGNSNYFTVSVQGIPFTTPTASAAGTIGMVPTPAANTMNYVLTANGWAQAAPKATDADTVDGKHASDFALKDASFKLGNTQIKLGDTCTAITGPFAVHTDASVGNAFSIRRSSTIEEVKHWVDDNTYHIEYTNDEKANQIAFRFINTDTEAPSDPPQTTDKTIYLKSDGGVYAAKFVKDGGTATQFLMANGTTLDKVTAISNASTDSQIPTAKAVYKAINDGFAANDAMIYKGTYNANGVATATSVDTSKFSNAPGTTSLGWTWKVINSGFFGNIPVEPGDMIIATVENPGTTTTNYNVIQYNIDMNNLWWADQKWSATSNNATTPRFGSVAINQAIDTNYKLVVSGKSALKGEVWTYQTAPWSNNTYTLGTSSYRWSNIYSVLGNFSGQITSSVATGTAPFSIASTTRVTNLNADMLDGYHYTSFLRKESVVNNAVNDLNTFENMTLTGRGDPTTGASLSNAPWTGSGPAGGYGVLTYLWSGYGTQMAWGYNSNRIYIRNKYYSSSTGGAVWQTSWDSLALTSDLHSHSGTANRMAYWSNATTLAATNHYTSTTKVAINSTSEPTENFLVQGDSRLNGKLEIFPTQNDYREGIRIHSYGSWSDITLCGNDNTGLQGISANSWFIGNNNGNFYLSKYGSTSGTVYLQNVSNVWRIKGEIDHHHGNSGQWDSYWYTRTTGTAGDGTNKGTIGIAELCLGNSIAAVTTADTGANNAKGLLRFYNSGTSNATIEYGDSGVILPSVPWGKAVNTLFANFRPDNSGYYSGLMYQTNGNEALVFANKNAVTSYMFLTGTDPTAMNSGTWTTATPALQIKQNSVYINELIANGVTPKFKLRVNGEAHITDNIYIGRQEGEDTPYRTSEGAQVMIKRIMANYPGYSFVTFHMDFAPNGKGYCHVHFYSTSVGTSHPENGLPEHCSGVYFSHGGAICCFGTAYGVWYFNTVLDNVNSSVSGGGSSWGSSITVNLGGTSKTLTIPANPNTDYRVQQSQTTTDSWRPVVAGSKYGAMNSADLYATITDVVYTTNKLTFQPSTGSLYTAGTISMAGTGISYIGSKSTNEMIHFINNTSDAYGNGIRIGGGGAVIIGAGESAASLESALSIGGGTETTYITSDGNIEFYTACDTIANRKRVYIDTNGYVYGSYFNSNIGNEDSMNPVSVYCSNDNWIRKMSLAKFKEKLDNLENTVIIKSFAANAITSAWADTGIAGANLATGTYIVEISVTDSAGAATSVNNFWNYRASGVMSWYKDNTNDTESDEIILHRTGHAYHNVLYLRTLQTASGGGGLKLQISSNTTLATAMYVTFKFKKIF